MKREIPKYILMILLCSSYISCVTKDFDNQNEKLPGQSLNESTFDSLIAFDGLKNISDISDSSVILSWSESVDAQEYYIYELNAGVPVLVEKLAAPAASIQLTGLSSGTFYGFSVKVKDSLGLLDKNNVIKYATTNSFPEPPSFLIKSYPFKFNDIERSPRFLVYGVYPGDTVSLYTDSACTVKVAEEKTDFSYIDIKTDKLSAGVTYTFYAKRKNVNGIESICSTATASYNLLVCPDGFLKTSSGNSLGIDPFCIMKYEAKAWSDSDNDNIVDSFEVNSLGCNESNCSTKNWGLNSYLPGSSFQGKPWRMLDISSAKQACQKLGINYDLVSNREWMAVAEEVEANTVNWSSGVVGSGCIYQGNTGHTSTCSYSISNIDQGISRDSKAALALNSAELIWDFSGNVAEWIDWGSEEVVTRVPISCNDEWSDISADFCNGNLLEIDFLPFNPANIPISIYKSNNGLGKIEGGVGGYVVRGGAYLYGELAGIYSASLAQTISSAREEIGFRCVYRIPSD